MGDKRIVNKWDNLSNIFPGNYLWVQQVKQCLNDRRIYAGMLATLMDRIRREERQIRKNPLGFQGFPRDSQRGRTEADRILIADEMTFDFNTIGYIGIEVDPK